MQGALDLRPGEQIWSREQQIASMVLVSRFHLAYIISANRISRFSTRFDLDAADFRLLPNEEDILPAHENAMEAVARDHFIFILTESRLLKVEAQDNGTLALKQQAELLTSPDARYANLQISDNGVVVLQLRQNVLTIYSEGLSLLQTMNLSDV